MSQSWKPLSLSPNTSDRPPLLISSHFTPTSYTIRITDLTRLWTETLDRRAILRRSLNEDTVIDPSEDAEQMRMLLQKIEGAIRGDKGTELTLKHNSSADSSDATSFNLLIIADLPEGLPPLKWPVSLSQSDPLAFTKAFTLPLLAAQNAQMKETENLMEVLKDKDHVIQKLVDRLEASGSDLGQVFPIAALKGKGRKATRAQVAGKVKGLGVFEKSQWKKDMTKDISGGDLKRRAVEFFGTDNGLDISNDEEVSIPGEWKNWWINFNGTSKSASTSSGALAASPPTNNSKDNQNEDDYSGGDLQVQSTPLRSSQNSINKRSSATMDDSTEDEDGDLDALTQRSAIPDSFPISSPEVTKPEPKGMKLGTIGKPKNTAKPSPPPQVMAEDDATTDDESMNSPPAPSPPSPPKIKTKTPVKSKKVGLGRIGGRKREASPLSDSTQQDVSKLEIESDNVQSSPEPQRKPKKLGVIGHKSQVVSSYLAADEKPRGRSPAVIEKEKSPPRETSDERRERRNKELKKELEANKPVKKKRKF